MERLTERLAMARRALSTLQEVTRLEHPSRIERDAAIQRFEYTCEGYGRRRNDTSKKWKASVLARRKGAFERAEMLAY